MLSLSSRLKPFFVVLFSASAILCSSPLSSAGYLEESQMGLTLSLLGDSPRAALEAYIQTLELDEEEASAARRSISYGFDSDSEATRQWAAAKLASAASPDFELIAAAYVVGQSHSPTVSLGKVLTDHGYRDWRGRDWTVSNFASTLERFAQASFPIYQLPERFRELTEKGLQGRLSEEETSRLKELLLELLAQGPPFSQETLSMLYLSSQAFIHQTGDEAFLIRLWNTGEESLQRTCIEIGGLANKEPALVQTVLELTKPLEDPDARHRESLRLFCSGLFKRQKEVEGVGERVRAWAHCYDETPSGQMLQQMLLDVMGERGWPRDEEEQNRGFLSTYIRLQEINLEHAEAALSQIEERASEGVRTSRAERPLRPD